MAWGVRWYLVGSVVPGLLGVLAGCSGGFFAEREPWRHEAEVQCIDSGAAKEGPGVVRVKAIRGPGVCGADFPLRVLVLGESAPLGYSDDPRPPGAIPGTPRWPVKPPVKPPGEAAAPPPDPPGNHAGSVPELYDFRRPYGAPLPRLRAPPAAISPREDFSPEPYERRPLIDAPARPAGIARAPLRELPDTPRASAREAYPSEPERRRAPPPVAALGPARGARATGSPAPVAVSPAATLACPLVTELDRWIAGAVQPAALRWFGAPVAEITQISAYSCRGMNGNPRARISEHAFGNALDISAFTLADGRRITVKGGWRGLPEEQGFLRDIQGAACDQFTTVLAPGSNVYHYDHIHVDLMRRRDGHRACNPHPVAGEEVAARAGARYAGRRDPAVTGSLASRRPPSRRLAADPDEEELRERALPMAEPGNDGEDD